MNSDNGDSTRASLQTSTKFGILSNHFRPKEPSGGNMSEAIVQCQIGRHFRVDSSKGLSPFDLVLIRTWQDSSPIKIRAIESNTDKNGNSEGNNNNGPLSTPPFCFASGYQHRDDPLPKNCESVSFGAREFAINGVHQSNNKNINTSGQEEKAVKASDSVDSGAESRSSLSLGADDNDYYFLGPINEEHISQCRENKCGKICSEGSYENETPQTEFAMERFDHSKKFLKVNRTRGGNATGTSGISSSSPSNQDSSYSNVDASELNERTPHIRPRRILRRRHSTFVISTKNTETNVADDESAKPTVARQEFHGSPKSIPGTSENQIPVMSARLRHHLKTHENGMELAFERCKVWSKYANQLIAFVRNRLELETSHLRNCLKLAEQMRANISEPNYNSLPLVDIFEELMDSSVQFASRGEKTVSLLNQRFLVALENRQKDHDIRRKKLKADYIKHKKQLDACAEELRRARQAHNSKGEQYLRAREHTLRTITAMTFVTHQTNGNNAQDQQQPQRILDSNVRQKSSSLFSGSFSNTHLPILVGSPASGPELLHKKRKEVAKKRKAEEEAFNRKHDAENEVWRLERELEQRQEALNNLKCRIVDDLIALIQQCDLTTIACASHFFRAFADLSAPIPQEFDRLADVIRERIPGAEFMSFLQSHNSLSASGRSASVNSLSFRRDSKSGGNDIHPLPIDSSPPSNGSFRPQAKTTSSSTLASLANSGGRISVGGGVPSSSKSLNTVYPQSPTGSSSANVRRRNALNSADGHFELIAETSQKQRVRGKTSMTRLFEQVTTTPQPEPSEAAKSHRLTRTRQVTKVCAQCDHLVIFDAVKCQSCGVVWHKKCIAFISIFCGPIAHQLRDEFQQRRISLFGVPLKNHLEAENRRIPMILEKCIDELQKRGMNCKGLYRTCGVKSKVEQLCVLFEQTPSAEDIDLSESNAMNLASVVKLYLRRLPEPLLTYSLYNDWLEFKIPDDSKNSEQEPNLTLNLKSMTNKLPIQNYETLKFLTMHLNRVTWFKSENLMTAANLAAVIAPSLIWPKIGAVPQHSLPHGPSTPAVSAGTSNNNTTVFSPFTSNSLHSNQSSSSSSTFPDDPKNAANCSFINDAHRQSKVVELIIQKAFEIFEVDRQTDFRNFFKTYGLPEPEPSERVDGEIVTNMSSLVLADEDDDDEDFIDCLEQELEAPFTPIEVQSPLAQTGNSDAPLNGSDLSSKKLSTTSNHSTSSKVVSRKESYGYQQSIAPKPLHNKISSVDCGTNRGEESPVNGAIHQHMKASSSAPAIRRTSGKQRSFTTSILISPVAEAAKKFRGNEQSAQKDSRTDPSKTYRSGDIVVDVKKDQHILPPNPSYNGKTPSNATKSYNAELISTPRRITNEQISQQIPFHKALERTANLTFMRPVDEKSNKLAAGGVVPATHHQSAVVFTTGNDVSYV